VSDVSAFRVVDAFVLRGRGTAIVIDFIDDGRVWNGDLARVPLVSGGVREVVIRSVEFADGVDDVERRFGKVALHVGWVAPDEIARGELLETRRSGT
jgi:GTPase